METGAQLLDERDGFKIGSKPSSQPTLVTANMHTALPKKAPLNGCLSELQTVPQHGRDQLHTRFGFSQTPRGLMPFF
jgi:hypothetical protein